MNMNARVLSLVAGLALSLLATGSAADSIGSLDGPRGLALGAADRVVWAESDGSVYERGVNGNTTLLGSVPSSYIAPAVAVGGRGQTFVLTAAGAPGSGASTLYRWTPGRGFQAIADIGAYQMAHPDPNDLEGNAVDTNPFGVAVADGGVLVADAAHNDLLKVSNSGDITLVARLLPRMVVMPTGFPSQICDPVTNSCMNLPAAGTVMPSEAVATSVTVGNDGYYYVGELRGFPATPGTSQVWRIAPGTVNATCDPTQPTTGACRRFADGLTSIVDLAPAPDGGIYALELVKASWAAWELLGAAPVGGLFKIPAGGGTASEITTGAPLILPGGVDVDRDGNVWVAGAVFGTGEVRTVA